MAGLPVTTCSACGRFLGLMSQYLGFFEATADPEAGEHTGWVHGCVPCACVRPTISFAARATGKKQTRGGREMGFTPLPPPAVPAFMPSTILTQMGFTKTCCRSAVLTWNSVEPGFRMYDAAGAARAKAYLDAGVQACGVPQAPPDTWAGVAAPRSRMRRK